MPRPIRFVLLLGLASLAAAIPATAHHSFAAAFDMNAPVTVQGTITQVRLENPHSWFFLDVTRPDGKVEHWSFEAGTPSGMIRNGFKPGVIKKGVTVTIKGVHARDRSQNAGMLQQLITADGTVYGLFGSQEGGAAK
jgi:hypothetical protein